MIYSLHDIQILDIEQFVRKNVAMLLGDRPLTGQTLLDLLGCDIRLIQAATITTSCIDEWHILLSSHCWLSTPKQDISDYFKRLQPFPEAGTNSVRFDSVLYHLVNSLTLLSPGMNQTLKGNEPPESIGDWCSQAAVNWQQGMAFQL